RALTHHASSHPRNHVPLTYSYSLLPSLLFPDSLPSHRHQHSFPTRRSSDLSYKSQRYTPLDQINKQNVAQLKPLWVYQIRQAGSDRKSTRLTPVTVASRMPSSA